MTRVLFGGYDYSQAEREKQLSKGIEDIYDVWLLGSFMGDIEKNFGKQGKYIHNYLSFWRQFGIVPFTIFFLILLSNFLIIIKNWIFFKKTKKPHIFLICFTIFSLLQIIFARAFVFPYIWLSIGGISSYLNDIESNT
tara:strand:- start:4 stop:417 length:414 start_codon:yes stop_codon:yes gene_type:complete